MKNLASPSNPPLSLVGVHSLDVEVERGRNSVITEWTTGRVIPAVAVMRLDYQRATDVLLAGRFKG